MMESFDAFDYIDYLRRRWRVAAAACLTAVLLSLGVSLLLPKRYTATASVVIEPPGGTDARLTTAVSAMYLESLKSYEIFAGSDTLFARAAHRFQLVAGAEQPSDSLKRRVLKVSKLPDTRILQISATLNDPRLAQSLAQYVAEQTVNMSRQENLNSDQDLLQQAEKQTAAAQSRLEALQKRWSALSVQQPVESLQSEIDADVDLRNKLQQEQVDAQAEAAEYRQQQSDGAFAREQLLAAQARAALLDKRVQELQLSIERNTRTLASRSASRDALQAELKVAQDSYQTLATRLQDSQASAGTHAERLRVIDPGVVPQRPSSPNISLNVAVALFVALLGSIVYLSVAFVYGRRSVRYEPSLSRGMRA